MKRLSNNTKVLYTVGHSTRTFDQFLDLIRVYDIKKVIDIRTIPPSRHNPQFNQDTLRTHLKKSHIGYIHLKKLGGLRHTHRDSINTGWHNSSFRGFADYMATKDFTLGLEQLKKRAAHYKVVIMCAEAVPWRCHRSLIADALTVEGWQVFHIQSKKTAKLHTLTPFAQVDKGIITYPA
jgi:uncharacterized protein (DUF488 family)